VSQSLSTHLEIDINKATKNTNDNPLYYVQYAHARINQLIGKMHYDSPRNFDLLILPAERNLINMLHYFKHTIQSVAHSYEIQKITLYLTNLAKAFHTFYANNKIIDQNNQLLSQQRFYLAIAVKQVLKNGLNLLGITASNKM
jgi:arginyl-tRNA synthetase